MAFIAAHHALYGGGKERAVARGAAARLCWVDSDRGLIAMDSQALLLAAAAGAVSLAICAGLLALISHRAGERARRALQARLDESERRALAAQASSEAFDTALIELDG